MSPVTKPVSRPRRRVALLFALLAAVALLLIVASVIRSWWTVLPAAPRGPGPVDLACLVFMAATAVAWGLHRRRYHYE